MFPFLGRNQKLHHSSDDGDGEILPNHMSRAITSLTDRSSILQVTNKNLSYKRKINAKTKETCGSQILMDIYQISIPQYITKKRRFLSTDHHHDSLASPPCLIWIAARQSFSFSSVHTGEPERVAGT